jgi:hypothetical protein
MAREIHIVDEPARVANVGGQGDFCDDWTHRYIALEGGWGSGKTWAGARKLVALHMHNARTRDGDATFVPSAVVAPSYPNAMDFDVPALQEACEDAGLSCRWVGQGSIGRGKYAGPGLVLDDLGMRSNPSVILVRTAESPDKITGWQVGAYWADEAARWPEDWTDPKRDPGIQIRGRLRHPKARFLQGMYTYTNEGDHTRVHTEFAASRPDHAVFRSRTRENPLMVEFATSMAATLPPDLVDQYLEGGAASFKGQRIYRYFEKSKNVNPALKLDPSKPIHLSFDFNIAPGMHVELGQHWEERDLFTVCAEVHRPNMDTRDATEEAIKLLLAACGGKPRHDVHIFGDASGSNRWAGTGESCYSIVRGALDAAKIPFRFRVPAANPAVVDRVNAFNVALCDASGKVHWQCHPSCTRLIEDCAKLKWDKRGELDKAQRNLSHPSDAEGYRVHFLRPIRMQSTASGSGRVYA